MWVVYILKDLCGIVFRLIHPKPPTVEQIYVGFLTGKMTESRLYVLLRIEQVPAFIDFHHQFKRRFENSEGKLDIFIGVPSMLPYKNRIPLGLAQIDALIDRDILKSIERRRGRKNVVRREN